MTRRKEQQRPPKLRRPSELIAATPCRACAFGLKPALHLVCRACWLHLPKAIRNAFGEAQNPEERTAAAVRLFDWLRYHPRPLLTATSADEDGQPW